MNNNKNFDGRQDASQERYVSRSIAPDGLMSLSERSTYIDVYSPKTPYNKRKSKTSKGFNGLSSQQERDIEVAVYKFLTWHNSYPTNNVELPNTLPTSDTQKLPNIFAHCKWFVLTYDTETSDKQLINILTNFSSVHKSITYCLNKVYDNHSIKPLPYIIVYGLRPRTSYARGIPCIDINILCVTKDKYGYDLFNEQTLIKNIYKSISKQSGDAIKIPDYYAHCPNNALNDYKQLANYLKSQVNENALRHFQRSEYASKLLNTWVHIPESLKEDIRKHTYKDKHPGTTIKDHRKILQQKFSDEVTIKDKQDKDYKLIAQLNNSTPERIKQFNDNYSKELYLKLSNTKQCNNLSKGDNKYRNELRAIIKTTPIQWGISHLANLAILSDFTYDDAVEIKAAIINALSKFTMNDKLNRKFRFIIRDYLPVKCKIKTIKTIADLAIALNSSLVTELKEAEGLKLIEDAKFQLAIIYATIELIMQF